MFRRILFAVLLLLPTALVASPAQAAPVPPLRILLTNDDGYNSTYLQQLRTALIAAGHQVTVVAPASDQSAVGTQINIKFGTTIQAQEVSPGIWQVGGSPSDAVAFGLNTVFGAANPPDLVFSGPNPGENVAALVNSSGTVGATVTSLAAGVPGIALSIARSGSSFPTAPQAIAFGVKLVGKLSANRQNGRLLPPHTGLNVNYPTVTNGSVVIAPIGLSLPINTAYTAAPGTCAVCYVISPVFSTTPDPNPDSDRTQLLAGNVTVTPLDGTWDSGPIVSAVVRNRITGLAP